MAGIRERFEKAIITGEWSEICAIYEFLYNDKSPRPPEIEQTDNTNLVSQLFDEIDLLKQKYLDPDHETPPSAPRPSTKKSNGSLEAITFSTQEDDIPEYKEQIKKLSKTRKKERRQPYIPDTRTCESCNSDFDFKSEYPAGTLTESTKTLCGKCNMSKYGKKN